MKKYLVFGFCIGFLYPFYAQEKEIETVEIEGKFLSIPLKNISENVEVITREDIRKMPAHTLEDVLQFYTGIDIRKRGAGDTQADLSIRGSSYDQVLVLIDGVRMSDAQTGHNTMSLPFDLNTVDKIEIIKGPAARRFGQNAYAGVINIVTKISDEKEVKVYGSGGDFKTWSLGSSVNLGSDNFANYLQLSNSESDGYRHNTDYKVKNVWYQNRLNLRNGHLKLQAGFIEKKFGANGFYATPSATEQYEETQTSLVSILYDYKKDNLGINANLFWRRAQDLYLYQRDNPSFYRNLHIGNNYGAELNFSYHSKLGTSGIGIEMHREDLSSNNLGTRKRWVNQLFAEHHFSLFQNRLTLIPGISWINYQDTGNFFYPGLDVGFQINDRNKIYGNIAKVHRLPTYTDLYYISATEEGNPDLKPENALSYEIGYRYFRSHFLFKTSFFGRNSKNAIDWGRADENSIWIAENIGKLTTKGFEVEVEKKWEGFLRSISASYTYLDIQSENSLNQNSRYALENLRHQFNSKVNFGYKRFNNALIFQYNRRVFSENYFLLDEKISYTDKNWEAFLLINNLTNSKYLGPNLVPMPGRWFMLGFTWKGKL